MRRNRYTPKKALALLLTLILMLSASPVALAESYSAYVSTHSMSVYSSASLSKYLGSLDKYTIFTVTGMQSGVARIEYKGRKGYVRTSDFFAVADRSTKVEFTETTRIYKSYTTNSASMTVPKGMQANMIAVANGWALVEREGVGAYVPAQYLSEVWDGGDFTETPTPAPTATPAPSESIPAVVTDARVGVYAGKTSSTEYLGSISRGTEVNVLDYGDYWAYIELNGRYGYCKLSALTRKSELVTPTPTPTPAPTATPAPSESIPAVVTDARVGVYAGKTSSTEYLGSISRGTEVNVLDYGDYWAYIELNGRYGYCKLSALTRKSELATPTPTPDLTDAIPAVVVADRVSVYAGKTNSTKYLGSISKGTQVNVLDYADYWAYIEMNGKYGYCMLSALRPLSAEPSATPDPMDGFIRETFDATVDVTNALFYAEASTSSASKSVPLGTGVTVYGYNREWAAVKIGDESGFIQHANLNRDVYGTLSSGSGGTAVSTLEKALLALGYFDDNPDTTFNSYTAEAVAQLRSACGMSGNAADADLQRVLYSGNAPYCGLLSQTYSSGSTGSYVKRLQLRLYALDYLSKSSSVDGDFGSNTARAVKLFQAANGLNQSGVADSATLRAMYSTSAVALPSGKTPGDVGGGDPVIPSGGNQVNNSTNISKELASTTTSYNSGMSYAEKIEYAIYVGQNQLGKPYVYGATGTSSFDCSGFTGYCYKKIGISLPRTAYNQGYNSSMTKISSVSELRRGDLVFFNTVSDSDMCDHAGIYLGAGWFIHASSGQAKVVVSTLASGYYNRVFSWGRRAG